MTNEPVVHRLLPWRMGTGSASITLPSLPWTPLICGQREPLLSSPPPCLGASSLVKCLRGGLFGPPRNPKHLAMRADRWLRQRGFSPPLGDRRLRPETIPQPLEQSEATIAGRLLLPTGSRAGPGKTLRRRPPPPPISWGRCDRRPGIDSDGCVRCGNQEVQRDYCPLCLREDCGRCPDCSSMGEIRSCRLLYFAPSVNGGDPCQIQPIFPGELTLAQERASLQLKDVLYSSREVFICQKKCAGGGARRKWRSLPSPMP